MSAPTMAESLTTLEQECTRLDSTVAALRLQQELAPPNGSWWQALQRNKEPTETLAAHYRNALAAMRAVTGKPDAWGSRNRKSGVVTSALAGAVVNKADLLVFHDEEVVPLHAFPQAGAR